MITEDGLFAIIKISENDFDMLFENFSLTLFENKFRPRFLDLSGKTGEMATADFNSKILFKNTTLNGIAAEAFITNVISKAFVDFFQTNVFNGPAFSIMGS